MDEKKSKKRPADRFTRQEILLMFAKVGRGKMAPRNKAGLAMMYRCGLRNSEVSALMPKDVDLKGLTVNVRHGKGDKQRVVGMDPQTATMVELWMVKREQLPSITLQSTLFCSYNGKRVHTSFWRKLCPRLAKRAGIHKRVHPHGLRHMFAIELLEEGVSLEDIRRLMGHSSINQLITYLARLGLPDTLNVIQQRKW